MRSFLIFLSILILSACGRYAVTLNEQTLYDPRDGLAQGRFADPGLQACITLALQQENIDEMSQIQALNCAGMEIRSLEGVEALSNLQIIDVSQNRLVHLDALRRSNRLRVVNASDNPLNDISGLQGISTLNAAILRGATGIPCQQLERLSQRLGENLTRPENCAAQR